MASPRKRLPRTLIIAGLACALAVAAATPASAGVKEVTRGDVVTLDGGAALGYEIEGRVHMVRTANQSGEGTYVEVRVRGLDPNTTYPTHVHDAPCSATPPGGGHYQHEVGGAVDAINEIWPFITTNAAGVGRGTADHAHFARPEAQSIIIHYPADTAIRLACADLS